jgi:phenylacetate-CoA ligase
VGGTFWSLLLRTGVSGVETFQVVQHALRRLEIRVTPEGCLGEAGRATLVARIRAALGEGMQVEFKELARLAPLPSGKHRFVVSLRPEATPTAEGEDR